MFSPDNYAQFQATPHPLLEAYAGQQFGNVYQARGNHHYPRPHSNFKVSHRPLKAAGTNYHESYSSGPPSGYGPSSSGWEQEPAVSAHSGGGGGGGGYGHSSPSGWAQPHPSEKPGFSLGFGNLKKGRNSAMTALTLLSFFFFVNLLQTCLKEHMNTISPTVMVMTNGVIQNRYTKLAEMNSREHSNTSPSASTAADGHIVLQPEDLVSAAASVVPMTAAPPTVLIQSPYSGSTVLESHLKLQNPYATPPPTSTVNSMSYDTKYDYPNRTSLENQQRPQQHHYDNERHYERPNIFANQQQVQGSDSYAAYGGGSSSIHDRFNTPYSAASTHEYYNDRNNYDGRDRYGYRHYTRLY